MTRESPGYILPAVLSLRLSAAGRAIAMLCLVLPVSGALGGCASEMFSGSSDDNPGVVKKAAMVAGFATKAGETKEFIASSRPAGTEFMPVGVSAPARPTAAKSKDEVKALEQTLEATRTANEAAGAAAQKEGQTPNPTPVDAEAASAPR